MDPSELDLQFTEVQISEERRANEKYFGLAEALRAHRQSSTLALVP
jgi:hypothetical protein